MRRKGKEWIWKDGVKLQLREDLMLVIKQKREKKRLKVGTANKLIEVKRR